MGPAERQRLYDAALDELGERGYEGADLDDALARAGVSRPAFEAEFSDKDSCLFAAYDELTGRLVRRAATKCDRNDEWPRRVRTALGTILDELAAEPRIARALVCSFPAIRPLAYLRYMEFLESFAPFLREGRDFSDLSGELPGEIEMLAIGAAEALVFEEIDAGRASQLPSQAQAILFSLLVPFMGPERALAAISTPAE
jgi:AcrR family transcriptional regulator